MTEPNALPDPAELTEMSPEQRDAWHDMCVAARAYESALAEVRRTRAELRRAEAAWPASLPDSADA